ncbi:MAG TPA: SCP2 sterol-binding domain-containing protein [Burkholderiaceae bacterium]|nr:SCP2 sterol-binding domain-containing protein [Burkholderiaceae bacterium]
MKRPLLLALAAVAGTAHAQTAPVMSPAWAQSLCTAWNAEPVLTDKLVESGWVGNDGGRGFKAMQVYRADCPASARIELQVALKDGKAQCVYGGAGKTDKLNGGADYLMWAESARWKEMGTGEYGPMRAMMFGRLNFEGPKMEAMGNMGPFGSFLLLVGKVPGDWGACP